jgi:hypothetical protein
VGSSCPVTYRTGIQATSPTMNDIYTKCDAKRHNPEEGLKMTLKGKLSRRRLR